MHIRIGYGDVDRLLRYPDVRYLSGCCLPIRMCVGGREFQSFTRVEPRLEGSGPRGRSQAWFLGNVARNSPAAASNLEFASLELQRFERHLKTDRGKLCATFIRRDPVAPSGPPAPSTRVMRGVCSLARPFVPCHTLWAYLDRLCARGQVMRIRIGY